MNGYDLPVIRKTIHEIKVVAPARRGHLTVSAERVDPAIERLIRSLAKAAALRDHTAMVKLASEKAKPCK